MKHYTWLYKATAIVNALSLVFQLLYPGLFVLATTSAQAAGIPAASLSFDGGKNAFHLSVSTQQEVKYSLWYARENGPTEAVSGTEAKTPQFEKEIYAGTCSNGTCVPHQVNKGLLHWSAGVMQGAIVFVVDHNSLSVKSTYGIDKLDLTSDEEKWLNETDASPPTSSLAAPTVETPKECLAEGAPITTVGDWAWKIDNATGLAETKEVVKLGVKYVFPQNNNVSVTFTCLPKDASLRTSLKIQQVKTADLKLPSDMTNVGEYAYDITTGMEDGAFNYDVTLPKAGDGDPSISYIEKPLETAKNYQIGAAEIRRVSDINLSEFGSQVKASNLDHFTIYITTYLNNTFIIEKPIYSRGEIVYVKAGDLNSSKYYKLMINPPGNGDNDLIEIASCQKGNVSGITGSYSLSSSAVVSESWTAELRRWDNADCSGNSNRDAWDNFEVISTIGATNPDLSSSCGLDIALVLDTSSSIGDTELAQMKTAYKAFVDALSGTPTQFSVTQFNATATILQNFTADAALVKSKIDSVTRANWTNWQDGLLKANTTLSSSRASYPNLVLFASDGNPNSNNSGTNVGESTALASAVTVANTIKTGGSRILALGIGNDLNVANLEAISGTSLNTGNVLTSDVITTNFSTLASQLATFATQTCGGTITINKYIDSTASGNLATDPWTFTTNVTGHTSVQTTAGQINFPVAVGTGYSITEFSVLSGYTFGTAQCRDSAGQVKGTLNSSTRTISGINIAANDIISCNFVNMLSCHAGQHTLEGKIKSNGYTTGNLCSGGGACWTEGENIPARLTITGLDVGVANSVVIQHDYMDDHGIVGYENFNTATSENGSATGVSLSAASNVDCGSGTTCKQYTLSFVPTSSTVQLDWQALLSSTAAQWNGASLHYRLISGACGGVGNKDIPLNPKQLTILGSITPIKSILNGAVPADWTFNITGNTNVNGVASGSTASNLALGANNGNATYTITEVGPSGWELDSVSAPCTKSGSNSATVTLTSATHDVACTFTNKRTTGTIVVDKVTLPSGSAQSFAFTTTGSGYAGFSLTDAATPNSQNLVAGTYSVAETAVAGWDSRVVCASSIGDTETALSLELDPSETITCTFTNTQKSHLVVQKTTGPSGDPTVFTISASSSNGGLITGGGTGTVSDATDHDYEVTPGTYSVIEIVPTGWGLTSNGCTNVAIAAGETKYCTLVNRKLPVLTVEKVLNGISVPYSNFSFKLNNGIAVPFESDGNNSMIIVPDSDYSVVEVDPGSSYNVTYSTGCTGRLTYEQTATCTITNTEYGSLTFVKDALPSSSQAFSFIASGSGLTNFSLTDDGSVFGIERKTFSNLLPGTYSVTETSVVGWDMISATCDDGSSPSAISLSAGKHVTCTFTNVMRGAIGGHKYHDDDGDLVTTSDRTPMSGWTIELYQNGTKLSSTTTASDGTYGFTNLVPGSYTLKEGIQVGWIILHPSTNELNVAINPGQQDYDNDFINTKYGSITVYKDVDIDADGDIDATHSADWKWDINGSGGYVTGSTQTSVLPGTYTISEEHQDGYHVTSLICNNGITSPMNNYGAVESQSIALKSGQDLVCTFTNTRDMGTLRIVKELTNNNGGSLKKDDFSFKIDGGTDISFNTNGINEYLIPVGPHTIVENLTDGYLTSYSNCSPAVVTLGNTTICTVINDDQPAQLTLIKHVTNNNGGNDLDTSWTLTASGSSIISGITGSASVTNASVSAGVYSLSESGPTGYEAGDWNCVGGSQLRNQITLANGQHATCTITNDDITPTLTVVKNVVNDNGGTLVARDFSIRLNSDLLTFNVSTQSGSTTAYVATPTVIANTPYILSEADLSGYNEGSWSCIDVNTEQIVTTTTLNEGQNVRCTITNNDVAPKLRLIKSVRSGTAQPSEFTLTATGTNGFSDLGNSTTFHPIDANTPYTLSESTVEGYSQLGSWSCDQRVNVNLNSQISLSLGQNVTCTVTNTRDTGSVKVNKLIDMNGDGDWNDWGDEGNNFANSHGFNWVFDSANKSFGNRIDSIPTTTSATTHTFSESMPVDYHFVSWYNSNERGRSCENPNGTSLPTTINVTKDKTTEITLCNARNTGTLIAHKFEDNNTNTVQDTGELSLRNWDINLYSGSDCRTGNYLRDLDTNSSGDANFGTLTTGNYSVREESRDGWHNTTPLCQNVTVTKDSTSTVLFGNYRTGSITIKKFTHPASVETFTYRGTLGTHTFFNNYDHEFDNLEIGTYTITEDQKNGWYLNNLSCTSGVVSVENRTATISITPDLDVTCTFQNYKMGTIHGEKYFDQDGNGNQGLFEPFMNGWRIFLDEDGDGIYDEGERFDITHGSYWFFGWHDLGDYVFENLTPGEYQVCEEMQTGWIPVSGSNCKTATIHAEGGDVDIVQFGNWQVGTVTVYKYNDVDGNGEKNGEETYLPGWTIYLQGDETASQSAVTDEGGSTTFTRLTPGTYEVSEQLVNGWEQTGISCRTGEEGLESSAFTLRGGEDVVCEIGNRYITPELTIEKSNNSWPNTIGLGGLVTYTIKVKALKNPVYNVQVRDLLPLDVKYQTGSYHAESDKYGVLAISEPTYASPGTWSLPTMEADEVITLTYVGKVGGDVDAGIYKDVAWARGTAYDNSGSEYVVASAIDEGKIADTFVGTNILVDRSLQENVSVKLTKEVETEGKVLGVTSELPATGQSSWLSIAALVSIISGLGIQLWLLKRLRKQHE